MMADNDMAPLTPVAKQHLASADATRIFQASDSWPRALSWWRAAAELAPALPLGLAADLGLLLLDGLHQAPEDAGQAPAAGSSLSPTALPDDAYTTFLQSAAATPAIRAACTLTLSDVAIAALLAHLAQAAPIPPAYRLPPGVRPATVATALTQALTQPPTTPTNTHTDSSLTTHHSSLITHHSSLITHHSSLLPHLLTRLQSLAPADVRFVAALGQGALGVTDLADLRALTELLSLPALSHTLIDEVLAFLPALAEVAPGAALQTYAVDGYAGLARSGSLDAVLPSEWALPERLLHYRYLNGELLYYGHERPPERQPTLLLLLVQLSDAMAGDLEPLVKASALALARAGQARGATVQVATFNTRLHPPQGLTRPVEVAALIRQTGSGRVDMARVLTQVGAQVRAQAGQYARIELVWLLHAQAGADQVGAVRALAGQLRTQVGSRALFVSAGAGVAQPALAGVLTGPWASLGSAALHAAEERAKAARALRGLARPHERERLAVEPVPQPRRRVVNATPAPAPDPVAPLLAAGQWEAALAALAPRAHQDDATAKALLATIIEGAAVLQQRPSLDETLSAIGYRLSAMAYPLPLRLQAAALLGATGDPRLLDPQRGEAPLGGYWCPVEAGTFWYGEHEHSLRQVALPYAYRIGRYPVTNAEYAGFIAAGGYQEQRWWTEQGWTYLQPGGFRYSGEPERITLPRFWEEERYNQPNQPVVGVSWYEAAAYCIWLTEVGRNAGWLAANATIRLPTSLEWERAARGIDQRRYPWGNEPPDPERANYQETGIGRPTPVGCFPAGAAPSGALDLAGNVMEWMSTPVNARDQQEAEKDFTPDGRVLLSYTEFRDNSEQLSCGARDGLDPYYRNDSWSFRVVWS